MQSGSSGEGRMALAEDEKESPENEYENEFEARVDH